MQWKKEVNKKTSFFYALLLISLTFTDRLS